MPKNPHTPWSDFSDAFDLARERRLLGQRPPEESRKNPSPLPEPKKFSSRESGREFLGKRSATAEFARMLLGEPSSSEAEKKKQEEEKTKKEQKPVEGEVESEEQRKAKEKKEEKKVRAEKKDEKEKKQEESAKKETQKQPT